VLGGGMSAAILQRRYQEQSLCSFAREKEMKWQLWQPWHLATHATTLVMLFSFALQKPEGADEQLDAVVLVTRVALQ
tara:strand:- start:93 stop:323 length:231 start_codon:yes stop_codon:yes gene_type:complete